jgi:hypothetical protein
MTNLKNWKFLALLLATLLSSNAFAGIKKFAPFMPENNRHLLKKPPTPKGGITEQEFNDAVKSTTDHYTALAAAHGATLVVAADWKDDTVNAYADQDGANWNVHFMGGLARQPMVTADAMALVVCHELDHHFGGFPFFSDPGSAWGAVEGQADYGAAHFCANIIWKGDTQGNAKARTGVPAVAKAKCDSVYSGANEQNLCYRTANAAMALAKLLADGSGTNPAFETPDATKVTATNEDHPEAQCRLDTLFQAALCPVAFDSSIIPGKNNPSGQQSLDAQKEAFKYSCSKEQQSQGARPACWFSEM